MASIRERIDKDGNKSYHVQIRIQGFPPQTKTFTKKTVAKQWATQVELEIKAGRYLPVAMSKKRLTKDMIRQYRASVLPTKGEKQRRDYGRHLDWWEARLGRYGILELTSELLGKCRDELLVTPTRNKRPPAPASVVRRMAVFSHVLTTAVKEWQWLPDSPMARVKKPKVKNHHARYLSETELKRLLAQTRQSSSPGLHTFVVIAIATGMRYSEILTLRWSQVILNESENAGMFVLPDTKNGTSRAVPFSGLAFALMQSVKGRTHADHGKAPAESDLVFQSKASANQPASIRTAWRSALKKAEIPNFRFHSLRHTAASYLAMSGASSSEIAEILGHKSLQMVKRYAHLSREHVATVLDRMNETRLPLNAD